MSDCVTELDTWYLGLPGRMEALETDLGLQVAVDSAEVVHQLVRGGSTVTRNRVPKRRYTLPLAGLDRDAADQILRWYLRAYGPGPFMLVDPTLRNQLTMDGALGNAKAAYSVPAGQTLTYGATANPGGLGVDAAQVVDWDGAVNGSVLTLAADTTQGAGTGDANATSSPPYLPDEPCTVSVWLWASTPVACDLRVSGRNADGTAGTDVLIGCAVTAAPQRFTLTATPGLLGASKFVIPTVQKTDATVATIHALAPQLEYNPAANGWNVGLGVPRIVITKLTGPNVTGRTGYGDFGYELAEVG